MMSVSNESKMGIGIVLFVASLCLFAGCADERDSDKSNGQSPEIPVLGDAELYEFRLNQGVIELDRLERFATVQVSDAPECDQRPEGESAASALRYGARCYRMYVDLNDDESLEVSEGDLVFSPQKRILGKVQQILNSTLSSSVAVDVEPATIDEIFEYARARAVFDVERTVSTTTVNHNELLVIYEQALELDAERNFEFEQAFEHNFNTDSNPVLTKGEIKLKGRAHLDLMLGSAVAVEDKFVEVELVVDSTLKGSLEFDSGYDNIRETELSLIEFALPMQLGWLYADLVFEAKVQIDASFDIRAGGSMEWSGNQSTSSKTRWTEESGWTGEGDASASPISTDTRFNTRAEVSASTGLEFSTSLMLYKLFGPKLAVTPKLQAKASGSIAVSRIEDEAMSMGEGCLELKGLVDFSIDGLVRGLEDTELYSTTLVEETIASVGQCDAHTLPLDQEPPQLETFQFSTNSIRPGGSCSDYSGNTDPGWQNYLRAKARRCIENPTCEFSLQPCESRFGARPKRGTCTMNEVPIVQTFYSDVYECPERQQDGFAPCTLVRAQEFGEVTWNPEC